MLVVVVKWIFFVFFFLFVGLLGLLSWLVLLLYLLRFLCCLAHNQCLHVGSLLLSSWCRLLHRSCGLLRERFGRLSFGWHNFSLLSLSRFGFGWFWLLFHLFALNWNARCLGLSSVGWWLRIDFVFSIRLWLWSFNQFAVWLFFCDFGRRLGDFTFLMFIILFLFGLLFLLLVCTLFVNA